MIIKFLDLHRFGFAMRIHYSTRLMRWICASNFVPGTKISALHLRISQKLQQAYLSSLVRRLASLVSPATLHT
jgi:hypothetical protein